jgi:hypothetical protein
MTKFTSSLGLVVALCGCGTDSSPGSVSGTIKGQKYSVADAISASVAINGQHSGVVALGNKSGLCADIMAGKEPPNLSLFVISMATVNGLTLNTPTATGTFQIYQGGQPPMLAATVSTHVYDSSCADIANYDSTAITGTVDLTHISGEAYDGHYDVVMDSGEHITGTFSADACPALTNIVGTNTQLACM